MRSGSAPAGQCGQECRDPGDGRDERVRFLKDDLGTLVALHADPDAGCEPPRGDEPVERPPHFHVGAVVTDRDHMVHLGVGLQDGLGGRALADRRRGVDLERHPAGGSDKPGLPRGRRDLFIEQHDRAGRVGSRAVVKRQGRALVLQPDARVGELTGCPTRREVPERRPVRLRIGARKALTVREANLKTMIAGVRHAAQGDDATKAVQSPAADERQQPVASREDRKQTAQIPWNLDIFWMLHDRGQRAVEVEQDGARGWFGEEWNEEPPDLVGKCHAH